MAEMRFSKLRWFIAHKLDRLKGQCWTDLVCWAAYGDKRSPWSPIQASCKADGCPCYCGKLRDPEDVR